MTDPIAAARGALDLLAARPVRVVVVGDVVLDRFLYGAVDRISPEAPVPVVDVEREVFRLGGAANVVHNLRALGAEAGLIGVVGDDADAEWLRARLAELGVDPDGLVVAEDRPTAVKTRVIAQHQQVVRFDRERRGALAVSTANRLAAVLGAALATADAVIVSDYGKGVVDAPLMDALVPACRARGVFAAVDPKPSNRSCYRGVDLITPNARETEAMVGASVGTDPEAEAAGEALRADLDLGSVLVTRGERGMTLVAGDGPAVHIPARARDVYDVTGAGDTTIAVLTAARAAGAPLAAAACLANLAAGIVVGKLGTAVTTRDELAAAVAAARAAP